MSIRYGALAMYPDPGEILEQVIAGVLFAPAICCAMVAAEESTV